MRRLGIGKELFILEDQMSRDMKSMKRILVFCLLFTGSFVGRAQQDAMFSHYMFNTQSINPGYVGSREVLSVLSVIRSQWINFDGAPNTQTLSLNSPLFNDQLGFGFSIFNLWEFIY